MTRQCTWRGALGTWSPRSCGTWGLTEATRGSSIVGRGPPIGRSSSPSRQAALLPLECVHFGLWKTVDFGKPTVHPGVLDIRGRSDFSRFDPASPGDGPTLATLVRPRRRL